MNRTSDCPNHAPLLPCSFPSWRRPRTPRGPNQYGGEIMNGNCGAGEHLVVLIHGIRDIARWHDEIKQTLRGEGFVVESTNYGRMNLLEFLLPLPYFRNKAK